MFSPVYLWFAALALPLILLYFLKLKRRPVAVSSTLLWERTLEDLRVNSPFQRLKNSLLLWLQLAILLLLVAALARFFLEQDFSEASYQVLVIDTSASMQAIEEADGRTRFDLAMQAARDTINHAPGEHHFAIITFHTEASLAVPFTNERDRLRQALSLIEPSDRGTDPQEALRLAESLVEAQPSEAADQQPRVLVFTDGSFPRVPQVRVAPEFALFGTRNDNVGIVGFSARRRSSDPTRFDVAARIANFGDEPVRTLLEIRKDGEVIDVRSASLAPFDPEGHEHLRSYLIDDERLTEGLVTGRLLLDEPSALPTDNQAHLVLQPLAERRVLLVSDGHFYLERVLRTDVGFSELFPEVRSMRMGREEAKEALAGEHDFDVVIFDALRPEHLPDPLPPGSYVFVNCVPPTEGWGLSEPMLQRPRPLPPREEHPLFEFVELPSLQIREAPTLTHPDWVEEILLGGVAGAEPSPLISVGTRNERSFLVIGFDLFQSDWPLHMSFPVFWANLLRYLFRGTSDEDALAITTDEALAMSRPRGIEAITATLRGPLTADGSMPLTPRVSREVRLSSGDRFSFGYPSLAGLYEVRIGEERRRIAVNLANSQESDVRPVEEVELDVVGEQGEVERVTVDEDVSEEIRQRRRELWPFLLAAALVLLMIEWWVYHRRPFG